MIITLSIIVVNYVIFYDDSILQYAYYISVVSICMFFLYIQCVYYVLL